ncbi:VanZ like family protein [Nocardioides scoriae]|uniref:VanZ like family protein n=1 Tax=Nocardioides scoriae TaxID=642780 RepID=A0A1H1WXY3_9ACTN|nr:VanZ like family protein [Nocardioides scoriae]
MLFSPTSTLQSDLVVRLSDRLATVLPPAWVTYTRMEVVMNAVIIMPLSFLGSIAVRRWRWQDWTAYGLLGAMVVEVAQGLLLPDREPAFSDVVANALGAAGGALAHAVLAGLVGTLSRTRSRAAR